MNVLWISNIVMPKLAEKLNINAPLSGSWMHDISDMISVRSDFKLAIACVYGDKLNKYEIDNIVYYTLPGNGKNMMFYTKRYEKIWSEIRTDFMPDVVHLHGTEYSHGLSYIRKFPKDKIIISIQGILNKIKYHSFGGLSLFEVIINRTFKEYMKLNGMIENSFLHKINSRREKEIVRSVKYANCVNFWDYSVIKTINPKINVFQIDYNLRKEFYSSAKWDISNINRFQVFTNPGGVPLKGLHNLIRAIFIVKQYFDKVSLVVPGFKSVDGKLFVTSGYSKYIRKLVKKLKLENNIIFVGPQNTSGMIKHLLKSHITVIPSSIEGTSLILRESMYLGVPTISTFRGGMADYISDKVDGFLYDYSEIEYLAHRIVQVFKDDSLSIKFSRNSILTATKSQDRNKNLREYINMYNMVHSGEVGI